MNTTIDLTPTLLYRSNHTLNSASDLADTFVTTHNQKLTG